VLSKGLVGRGLKAWEERKNAQRNLHDLTGKGGWAFYYQRKKKAELCSFSLFSEEGTPNVGEEKKGRGGGRKVNDRREVSVQSRVSCKRKDKEEKWFNHLV